MKFVMLGIVALVVVVFLKSNTDANPPIYEDPDEKQDDQRWPSFHIFS